jgi:hypothetical protein
MAVAAAALFALGSTIDAHKAEAGPYAYVVNVDAGTVSE